MRFGSKKNVEKTAKKVRRKDMPICDVDPRSCEIMLDSGVVTNSRLDHGVMLVGDLMICTSPSCSYRILS